MQTSAPKSASGFRVSSAARMTSQLLAAICVLNGCTSPMFPTTLDARIVHVPSSIAADCSVDVSADLLNWIATVPDSTTLVFDKDACYNIDTGLMIFDRNSLVFEGNGSTFKFVTQGTPNRSNWTFVAGSNITLRNMITRGANPNAGTSPASYVAALEWQHAYRFEATQTATLDSVQAYDVYGDFVEAEKDGRVRTGAGEPARNIMVKNSRFVGAGRMGIGLTHVDGFTLQDSYIAGVRWSAIDLELDVENRTGINVRILRNHFGPIWHSIFTHGGAGTNTGTVEVSDNVMDAQSLSCQPPILVWAPAGHYWTGYTFKNNVLQPLSIGILVNQAKSVTIQGNTITGTGCGRNAGIQAVDSHDGVISGNTIVGAASVLLSDTLTTNFKVSDNTVR